MRGEIHRRSLLAFALLAAFSTARARSALEDGQLPQRTASRPPHDRADEQEASFDRLAATPPEERTTGNKYDGGGGGGGAKEPPSGGDAAARSLVGYGMIGLMGAILACACHATARELDARGTGDWTRPLASGGAGAADVALELPVYGSLGVEGGA